MNKSELTLKGTGKIGCNGISLYFAVIRVSDRKMSGKWRNI